MRARDMSIAESRIIAKIGLNISYYRKLVGLTQPELAEKCFISESTISNIETANRFVNPTILTMIRIADALQIPLSYLFELRS